MSTDDAIGKRKARPAKRRSQSGGPRQSPAMRPAGGKAPWAETVMRVLTVEAERDGTLAGEKSQHLTFRALPALVEAAKLKLGIASTSESGMLAFMMLAQTDPMVEFMKRTRGALGQDHTLEY